MNPFLLDTNIIVNVLRRGEDAHSLIEALLSQGQPLASCPITITEIYAGMHPHEEKATRAFMKSLVFLPVSAEIAEQAGLLKRRYAKRGKAISIQDATIAAVSVLRVGVPTRRRDERDALGRRWRTRSGS